MCCAALCVQGLQSFEYQMQFDTEKVQIGKAEMAPQEEMVISREDLPQMVLPLTDGKIVYLNAEGKWCEILLTKHELVPVKLDTESQLQVVNDSQETLQLMTFYFPDTRLGWACDEGSRIVSMNIKIRAEECAEIDQFLDAIPSGKQYDSYQEWKDDALNMINHFIPLLESEKVLRANYSVGQE